MTSNTTLIPARDCLSMPLNMKLSFAHSNVAAVEGAWPVMGFSSHQQMQPCWAFGSCCWVLLRPLLSPALWWPVCTTPPSHTSEELRSGPAGAHGSGGHRSWKLVCARAKLLGGACTAGCARPADAAPSADPRRWRPACGPVAGAHLGIEPLDAKPSWHRLWFSR